MNELKIIEHEGIRVLTTQQLAESYGTTNDVVNKNFNRNKERYEEGKHYFLLQGEGLKTLKAKGQIDVLPNANKFYLWTERGAFLHAKSLNTDKAWEVYDSLVEHYFQSTEQKVALPTNPMDVLKLIFKAQENTNKEVGKHEQRITELEENKLLNPGEYNFLNHQVRKRVKTIKEVRKLNLSSKQNSKIYSFINRDLNSFIGIKTRSQFKEKDFDKALNFISEWDLSYTDLKIIEEMDC